MSLTEPVYTPSQLEKAIGISNDVMRDRRKRSKGLATFGTKTDGGQYRYSVLDLVGLACSIRIDPYFPNVFLSERAAGYVANDVAQHLGGNDPSFFWVDPTTHIIDERGYLHAAAYRFAIFPNGPLPKIAMTLNDLEAHFRDVSNLDNGFEVAPIIDLLRLSENLPESVKEMVAA